MLRATDDEDFNQIEIKMADDAAPLNGSNTTTILRDVPAFQSLPRQKRRQVLAGALCAAGFLFLLVVYLVVSRNGAPSAGDAAEDTKEAYEDFPLGVRAMIDTAADPCKDFYQYSCGRWRANAAIPGDKGSIHASFSTVEDQNELVLKEIMAEHLPLVGELFNSCMNTTAIDAQGVTPLQGYLDQIQAVTTKTALFKLAGKLSKLGPNFLTGLAVLADAKDATVHLLYASQQGLSLPDRNYYLDQTQWDGLQDEYREYLTTLATLAGSTATEAARYRDVVVAFEQQLAKIFIAKEQLMDPVKTYNPVKLEDAMATYPLLLGAFLEGTGIPSSLVGTTTRKQASLLSVETPQYFVDAEKLVAATPLATLQVVFAYHLLRDFASQLSEPFVDATFAFFSAKIYGQKQRTPRWKVCLRRVTAHFPQLMGKYYFIKKFDTASEAMAKTMVATIEAAMRSILETQTAWLDHATKKAALAKMQQIANLIGHSARQESFPFSLSTTSYWANVETLNRFAFTKAVAKIAMPVDRDEWAMPASEVNAYYNPATNQIVFPAGILQPPFFDKAAHPSQNFGAIGAVIGHEITHGFDDNGRYYDGDGNLVDWWSDTTDAAFRSRAACLVQQYSRFPVVSDLDESTVLGHVNGNFTLGENIADNGGLKIAFLALDTFLFHRDEEEELRDKTMLARNTAERLYFVSFAQAFCAKSTDEAMVRRLNTDPHAPEQWRVNGAVMNNKDFARVFQCADGSPMAPTTTCPVW